MAIHSFVWGIESWQAGVNEFTIRFERSNIRILRIEGGISAAPQPNHQPFAQIIRQSIISLINVGSPDREIPIQLVSAPSHRANHSKSNHLFSLNIKQINGNPVNFPIIFDYSIAPIFIIDDFLTMHVLNESYKMDNGSPVTSSDQNDALNIEMHLRICYESE